MFIVIFVHDVSYHPPISLLWNPATCVLNLAYVLSGEKPGWLGGMESSLAPDDSGSSQCLLSWPGVQCAWSDLSLRTQHQTCPAFSHLLSTFHLWRPKAAQRHGMGALWTKRHHLLQGCWGQSGEPVTLGEETQSAVCEGLALQRMWVGGWASMLR